MPRHFAIGQPLPRAHDAYASREKWRHWILAPAGHGGDWARVFNAGPSDTGAIWLAIGREIRTAPLSSVRDRQPYGVVCGVAMRIALNRRAAQIATAWHYEHDRAAPVSSPPTP